MKTLPSSEIPRIRASFIIPVRNGEEHIVPALESLIEQSSTEFEVIVVNDQSTDATVARISALGEGRVRVLNTKPGDSGIVSALNAGIAASRGEFLVRMDADDLSTPQRLERQLRYMEKHKKVAICGSWASKFGEANGSMRMPRTDAHIRAHAVFHSPFVHPSVMIRRSMFETLGELYEHGYELAEDYRLWTQLLRLGKGKNLRKKLLQYRVHPKQHSISNLNARKGSLKRIQSDWLNSYGIALPEAQLELHVSIVTDASFLTKHPHRWRYAIQLYWHLNRANFKITRNRISPYWLMVDSLSTLTIQAAFGALVALGFRRVEID